MDPGPISDEVLYNQHCHRSATVSGPEGNERITVVDHAREHQNWKLLDPRVRQLVRRAGFLHCSELRWLRLDWYLITSLIERWRPETNTFHMRMGEMTITLQDVAVLMGLQVDGRAVCYEVQPLVSWGDFMIQNMGRCATRKRDKQGSTVKLAWLRKTYRNVPASATPQRIEWAARAYILHMIGTLLFPDSSKSEVHLRWLIHLVNFDICGELSWGSAVLAHLYEQMSKAALKKTRQLAACCTLLQAWAWERLSIGRPRLLRQFDFDNSRPLACKWSSERTYDESPHRQMSFYRNELDVLELTQVIWEPYLLIIHRLPLVCIGGEQIWRTRSPIMCWDIVHMHLPDRVLRQFGMQQHIPDPVIPLISRKGLARGARISLLNEFEFLWYNNRNSVISVREPAITIDAYMAWYWRITRRWIFTETTPPKAYMPRGHIERDMADTLRRVVELAQQGLRPQSDASLLFTSIIATGNDVLQRHRCLLHAVQENPRVPTITYARKRQRKITLDSETPLVPTMTCLRKHQRKITRESDVVGPSRLASDVAEISRLASDIASPSSPEETQNGKDSTELNHAGPPQPVQEVVRRQA